MAAITAAIVAADVVDAEVGGSGNNQHELPQTSRATKHNMSLCCFSEHEIHQDVNGNDAAQLLAATADTPSEVKVRWMQCSSDGPCSVLAIMLP